VKVNHNISDSKFPLVKTWLDVNSDELEYTGEYVFQSNNGGCSVTFIENGIGTLRFRDNTTYVGHFHNGKRQGRGQLIDSKKRVLEQGIYDNIKLTNGWYVIWDSDGQCRRFDINHNYMPDMTDFQNALDKMSIRISMLENKTS
jgi:hypothetical protein